MARANFSAKPPVMIIDTDSVVAVVGAGAMGSGIAQVAAQAGHDVVLVDSADGALSRSRAAMRAALEKRVARGKMPEGEKDALLDRIGWTTDMAKAASARLVIEAIVEDHAIKADLFGKPLPRH